MEPIFNRALKAGHVGFVTYTYIMYKQQPIKSYILAEDNLVYAAKGAPSDYQQNWPELWERDLQS